MGLDITGFGSVAEILGHVFDKVSHFIPDPVAKAEAQQKIREMEQAAEFKQIDALLEAGRQQTDINKIEAASTNLFVSGWRPACGWVCAGAFAYTFVLQPFLVFILAATHAGVDPKTLPVLDISQLMPVLLGMLGLGAMRSIEKVKGAIGSGH